MISVAYDAQGNVLGTTRFVKEIYDALQALTTTQKNNIWADLSANVTIPSGATIPKFLSDKGASNGGVNEGSIASVYWAAVFSGASGTSLTAARLLIASLYVQDNPQYLVNPAFDPTINVPGFVA